MPDVTESVAAPATASTLRTVVPGVAMIAVSFGLARYGYGLLLPEMQAELGMSSMVAGVVASGTYVSYLIANVAVVAVTARWGTRVALAMAALSAAAGMTLVAMAPNAAVAGIGVLVGGASSGFAFPPYADLVDRHVSGRRRDLAWSTISSGTGWGVALAGPVAILAGGHWRLVWGLFVGLALAAGAVAVWLAPPETRRARRPQLSWSWFFCPKSRPLLLSAVLVGAGSAVWWTFSVDALRESGIEATAAQTVYAVCGAASILASGAGAVFSRIGLRAGYLVADTLLAAALTVLGLATASLAGAMTAAILFGVFYCAVIAAHGVWSSRVFADHPAAGLSAVNTALTIGTLAGPSLAGVVIARAGFTAALVGAAAVTLTALVFCPPSHRRQEVLARHRCTAARVRS